MSKKIKFENVTTQKDAVLWHLQNHDELTSWTAIKEYGVTRLASLIHTLKGEGELIVSIDKQRLNQFGRNVNYTEYRLVKKGKKGAQGKLF